MLAHRLKCSLNCLETPVKPSLFYLAKTRVYDCLREEIATNLRWTHGMLERCVYGCSELKASLPYFPREESFPYEVDLPIWQGKYFLVYLRSEWGLSLRKSALYRHLPLLEVYQRSPFLSFRRWSGYCINTAIMGNLGETMPYSSFGSGLQPISKTFLLLHRRPVKSL